MRMYGEPPLDPPDDPPEIVCPECEGTGEQAEPEVDTFYGEGGEIKRVERTVRCQRCDGEGNVYATPEEIEDAAAEAAIERAEARRDGDL